MLRALRSPYRAAAVVFCIGLIAMFALWRVERQAELNAMQTLLNIRALDFANVLQTDYRATQNALGRAASRWGVLGGTPRNVFVHDSQELIDDDREVAAFDWIDRDLHVRWHVTDDQTVIDLDEPIDTRRQQFEFIAQARDESRITTSSMYEGRMRGHEIYVAAPLFVDGKFDGVMGMSYSVDRLLTEQFVNTGTLARITFMDTHSNMIERGDAMVPELFSRNFPVLLNGQSFVLRLDATRAFLNAGDSDRSEWALLVGFLINLLLTFLIFHVLSFHELRERSTAA